MESILKLLPLDNLYKFMAMSGLAVCLFCILYPDWRQAQLHRNKIELMGRIEANNIELKIANESMMISNLELKMALDKIEQVQTAVYRKYPFLKNPKNFQTFLSTPDIELARMFKDGELRQAMEFVIKNEKYFHSDIEDYKRYREAKKSVDSQQRIIKLKSNENNTLEKLISIDQVRIDSMKTIGQIGSCVGLVLSILGFTAWYFNNQRPQDKLLKIQLDNQKIGNKKDSPNIDNNE